MGTLSFLPGRQIPGQVVLLGLDWTANRFAGFNFNTCTMGGPTDFKCFREGIPY